MRYLHIRRPIHPKNGLSEDVDERERTGLHELWPGRADEAAKIETRLDIIAVHGLNGDLYKTWTDGGRLWLQDFLPSAIPDARIFTFGYNAGLAFSSSTSKIDDYAKHLLERLKARRRDFSTGRRPIIFICHSLGGLVFKKAMILAHERSDRYESLSRDVYGVMFMGTPHRGSDLAFWSKFFRSFVNTLTFGNIRTRLLKDLEPKSETLGSISSAFVERGKYLKKIFSFYEQQTIGGVLVVDPESAVLRLPNEVAIPLDADHRSMCRFSTASSERYLTVFDALKELVDDSLEISQSFTTFDRKTFIQSLVGVKPKAILRRIASPYAGTCNWFADQPKYQDWRAGRGPQILWLWGAPGTGKTVMMKYLAERWEKEAKQISEGKDIVAFFFCDDKDWLRRGHVQVVRSLLDQILAQDFELIRYVDAKDIRAYVDSYDTYGIDLPYQLAEILWKATAAILQRSRNTTFWFVLDALDELEPYSRGIALDHLSSIINRDLGHRVYMAFSDRVGLHARSFELPALAYELGGRSAEHDIRQYLSYECGRFTTEKRLSKRDQESIEKTMLDIASGNFLHATLAWANFYKGVSFWSSKTVADRLAVVRSISRDKVSYYCSLLEKIPKDAVSISKRAFAWIIGSRRALTVKELQHAVALNPRQSEWSDLESAVAAAFEQEFEENFAYLLRRDYDGFVRVTHQTVKEILISLPGSFSPANERILDAFRIEDETLHFEIARGCITLLSFKDFVQRSLQRRIDEMASVLRADVRNLQYADALDDEGDQFGIPDSIKELEEKRLKEAEQMVQDSLDFGKFVLVFYAACYWNLHFAKCSSDENAAKLLAGFLQTWQAEHFYKIPAILRILPMPRANSFLVGPNFRSMPPIHLSLQLGDYPKVIDELIQNDHDVNAIDRVRWTPLMYAIANRRSDSVKYLLSCASINVNQSWEMADSPLHLACRQDSDVEILAMMIDDPRTDINAKDMKDQTALEHLLTHSSFKDACMKLLQRRDLNISSKNIYLQTYLDQCFLNGLGEDFVIAILSRSDVNISALRRRPRALRKFVIGPYSLPIASYVVMASNWGWRRVESLVLQHDPWQALGNPDKGMSLLEIYAYNGIEGRLKELLDDLPADLFKKYDPHNSRLLHLCARQGLEEIAQLLQNKFGLNAIEADEHDRTILFYASEFEWASIITLCQDKSWEWINHQSRDGRTALIVAAENRIAVAVEALLGAGADVLIQDQRGRSALHAAAEHGHRLILKMLLEKPFFDHGCDFQQRTLLHYMVMWEAKPFVLRYIQKYRPVVDAFDYKRRTPLIYAAMHGNTSAGEALLESQADPHPKDASGSTALHYALSEGLLDFTKLLLEYHAPLWELDGFRRSALQLALRSKNVDLIEHLVNMIIEQQGRRKADPRLAKSEFDLTYMIFHQDVFGQTVMHRVCFLEDEMQPRLSANDDDEDDDEDDDVSVAVVGPCLNALRALGADINQTDRYNATPLHLATRHNNRAAVAALLTYPEIQVNVTDNRGCTSLDHSVAQGQIRITALLQQHGARHTPYFRTTLGLPPPQASVEVEYDPNLWAVVERSRKRF